MKLITLIAGLLFSANLFALGVNEVFDFNSGMQPNGAKLDNVCVDGDKLKVINPVSVCVKKTWHVIDDHKYDVLPHQQILTDEEYKAGAGSGSLYTPSCDQWSSDDAVTTIPMETRTCVEWKFNFKKWMKKSKCSDCHKCVKKGNVPLPRAQRLDVYLQDIGNGLVSSGQNMGSEMFTIPDCSDL